MSTGSMAANLHEGSRSEYLAQYVFASFGTAIAVPHHEDTGVDLYCTLTERVGRRAWPRMHYTVQVKSEETAWVFDGAESVLWLRRHPLPLFLCVVDKKEARLRVFGTSVRFLSEFPGPPRTTVRLHPGAPSTFASDHDEGGAIWNLALGEPILDATIVDLLKDDICLGWREVLEAWAAIDEEAISRSRRGVRSVLHPTYTTNHRPSWEMSSGMGAGLGPDAVPQLLKVLEEFSHAYQLRDERDPEALLSETLVCLLHRRLNSEWALPERGSHMMFSHNKLNALVRVSGHVFRGAEHLIENVRQVLGAKP